MKVWCAFRCGFGLGGLGFAVVVPVWVLVWLPWWLPPAGWRYHLDLFPNFYGSNVPNVGLFYLPTNTSDRPTQLLPLVKAMRWGYFGGAPGTVDRAVESVPWRSEVVPSGQNWEFQPRTCWWYNKESRQKYVPLRTRTWNIMKYGYHKEKKKHWW